MQRKLSNGGPHLSTILRVKRTSSGSTPLGQTKRSPNRLRLGQPKGCGIVAMWLPMDWGPYALGLQNATLMIQSGPALTQDPWGANSRDNKLCNKRIQKAKTADWKTQISMRNMIKCRQAIGIQKHMPCVNWNRTMLISISGWYSP